MKKSLEHLIGSLSYLPNRTPQMASSGGADGAFAEVAPYRDGAFYVGHYSGSSEWERHDVGDEIVLALEGIATVVLLVEGNERKVELGAMELMVVPKGMWHRFENSRRLKVLTVTPQPTDHSLAMPRA
jgi:mannose-6-phosphate isomerase-like protein (cupin superfamily)